MKHLKISTASKSNFEILSEKDHCAKGRKYKSSKIHSASIYDLKEGEIDPVEKLTEAKILKNIGIGGFSTVKLACSKSNKAYFAMKIVINIFVVSLLTDLD